MDRDGVLNIPIYRNGRSFAPTKLEDFVLYPDTVSNVDRLRAKGFVIIVITNQPDVGNGIVPESVINQMHAYLKNTISLDNIQVCFDTRNQKNSRLKPSPYMLLNAAKEMDIDIGISYVIGDRAGDILAGQAAGCLHNIFIDRSYSGETKPDFPSVTVSNLTEAVDWIMIKEDENLRNN